MQLDLAISLAFADALVREEERMKVEALMNPRVKSAGTDASVADVVLIMEKNDCGTVPILNKANKLVGIVTDRDICLAVGFRPLPAAGIPITDVMSKKVYACSPEEDVSVALQTMRQRKIRRLPVLDAHGRLVGILSMDDVILRAEDDFGETVKTLKAIYKRPAPRKEPAVRPEA
jgi:CBS domain-containing protein